MTTLDDKILGEKNQYYCSSSSSEGESENEGDTPKESILSTTESQTANPSEWNGLSRNTGPKGVIEDWQKYVQLRGEQQENSIQEQVQLSKKLSLTCKPDKELEDEESANFMLEYRNRRMKEMVSHYGNNESLFGTVFDIHSPSHFLQMLDEEKDTTTIIIHVYDQNNLACKKINEILVILADQYKSVKFCKVLTTSVGLSLNFKISGVPAFLVYKNKNIIGNYIRVTDELGDELYEGDIENYLIENGVLSN